MAGGRALARVVHGQRWAAACMGSQGTHASPLSAFTDMQAEQALAAGNLRWSRVISYSPCSSSPLPPLPASASSSDSP